MTLDAAVAVARERSWLSEARLRALWASVAAVIEADIPGAIVECGCATGGSAVLLGLAAGGCRPLHIFDGFRGLPEPSERDPDAAYASHYAGCCHGARADVERFLSEHCVSATIVEGMYADTLPAPEPRDVAVLHVDCDFYDSVMACLEGFYDRVARGGRIHIDDYGHWAGCRAATHDFFAARGHVPLLHRIDDTGVWLTKS